MARVKKGQTVKCPRCKKADMEMFGVTERGQWKFACPRCYHHIELDHK